jgi:hypothetical protein
MSFVALLDAPERQPPADQIQVRRKRVKAGFQSKQRGADQAQNAISSIRRWAVAASEVTMLMVFASRFSASL